MIGEKRALALELFQYWNNNVALRNSGELITVLRDKSDEELNR